MRPQPNAVYTTAQILQLLELSDTPHLRFYCAEYDEIAVVQTGHVTYEQLLAVPGFAELRWSYQFTTREWVPLFQAESPELVLKCVDVEAPTPGSYFEEPWVTPKGHPREQFVYDPNSPLIDWGMPDGQGA